MPDLSFLPADLAPGDARSLAFDPGAIEVTRVDSGHNPLFEEAYARLWEPFGAANELESRAVLTQRLARSAAPLHGGLALRYELVLVRQRGAFVAVRDHTAIADAMGAVVHLSHLFIDPTWRRSGLAGWLRALPIQTARAALAAGGFDPAAPITLAAEMEYADGIDRARDIRLRAYERAGFLKVDPTHVDYHQPDFRAPAELDASAPQPLPFQLILRRVARETETALRGTELRSIVARLYRMYGQELRPQEMAGVWADLDTYPPDDALIPLVPPTAPAPRRC